MIKHTPNAKPSPAFYSPVFNVGFRVFFLAGSIFSVLTMAMWLATYQFYVPLSLQSINAFQWHAHEMLYGYGMAVVAGFLLTAVRNWTGEQTIEGLPLALLFFCWLAARIAWLFGTDLLWLAALFDLGFNAGLLAAITIPIYKAKQTRQIPILSKIALILICHIFFYSALFFPDANNLHLHWGLYGTLYLMLALILTMGRRVLPFFIERGVGYPLELPLKNSRWLDLSSLFLLLGFFICEMFQLSALVSALFALAIFAVNAIRLLGWHTRGIWEKVLLWGLYLAFWSISLGFLLFALSYFMGFSQMIAIHAMTVGAIGLVTLAMMARVSLGHTGRSVQKPPTSVTFAIGLLTVSAIVRVAFPLIAPSQHMTWVGLSQILWILSFAIFSITYFSILSNPRIDGKKG